MVVLIALMCLQASLNKAKQVFKTIVFVKHALECFAYYLNRVRSYCEGNVGEQVPFRKLHFAVKESVHIQSSFRITAKRKGFITVSKHGTGQNRRKMH